jgi:hypothetical protein
VCTQEAAAALSWNYLLYHGMSASLTKLSRQFSCSKRRLVFYACRMAAVLEMYGRKQDQDNKGNENEDR